MSDSDNNQQGAPASEPTGYSAEPSPHDHLARIDAPSLAPEAGEPKKIEAADAAKTGATGTAKIEAADNGKAAGESSFAPKANPRQGRDDAVRAEAPRAVAGTALVPARPRIKIEPPKPEAVKAAQAAPRSGFRSIATLVAMAAVIGGLAGSLATAGITYLKPKLLAAPASNASFTAALGRVDRELAALKTGIDSSARATTQQVAKIADRMDRAEKAQADAGTKLAKTNDVIDRVERRLASAASPAAATAPTSVPAADVTGSVSQTRVANEAATDAQATPSSPSPLLLVDGWVLRDVYRGAAFIQGTRGGVIEVYPGDQLPALGRIEQVKRQDGRWVVVTSRGLIVQR